MNFSIEVPGEASPLQATEVARVLTDALSGDNSRRTAAYTQISSWNDNPDYLPLLLVGHIRASAC
jgi:hypothetical protein